MWVRVVGVLHTLINLIEIFNYSETSSRNYCKNTQIILNKFEIACEWIEVNRIDSKWINYTNTRHALASNANYICIITCSACQTVGLICLPSEGVGVCVCRCVRSLSKHQLKKRPQLQTLHHYKQQQAKNELQTNNNRNNTSDGNNKNNIVKKNKSLIRTKEAATTRRETTTTTTSAARGCMANMATIKLLIIGKFYLAIKQQQLQLQTLQQQQ